jgi:hypothetical protein
MANLAPDPDDALPDNAPPQQSDTNRKHHQQIADSLIENSLRAGHGGHMLGKAGPGNTGHAMPPSDAHKQRGQYIPQDVGAKMPQSTFSDGAGSANANPPGSDDYGKVWNPND